MRSEAEAVAAADAGSNGEEAADMAQDRTERAS